MRELYARPPDEFTAARDALSRALTAEGSPDAARVKQLRRPTVAVWLLNALARERPEAVEALLSAGDRLRQSQVRALRGDTAEFRTGTAALHAALATLTSAARAVSAERLGREPTAAVLSEVEGGLRAAATADADARAALQRGTLDRLPEPGGLELLTGLAAVRDAEVTGAREVSRVTAKKEAVVEAAERDAHEPTAGRGAKEKIKVESGKVAAPERARELRRASAEADRLERVARAAADRLRAAERRLADAQRDADAARAVAESARASAREARERADLARREAESGDHGGGRR